jgi:hypothetical protein
MTSRQWLWCTHPYKLSPHWYTKLSWAFLKPPTAWKLVEGEKTVHKYIVSSKSSVSRWRLNSPLSFAFFFSLSRVKNFHVVLATSSRVCYSSVLPCMLWVAVENYLFRTWFDRMLHISLRSGRVPFPWWRSGPAPKITKPSFLSPSVRDWGIDWQ